jgi:hypothetical protein
MSSVVCPGSRDSSTDHLSGGPLACPIFELESENQLDTTVVVLRAIRNRLVRRGDDRRRSVQRAGSRELAVGRLGLNARRVATLDDLAPDALRNDVAIATPLRFAELLNPGLTGDQSWTRRSNESTRSPRTCEPDRRYSNNANAACVTCRRQGQDRTTRSFSSQDRQRPLVNDWVSTVIVLKVKVS